MYENTNEPTFFENQEVFFALCFLRGNEIINVPILNLVCGFNQILRHAILLHFSARQKNTVAAF